MLRGATWSAAAIAGTAVFRIVVSSDSINTAIATNHGRTRLVEWLGKSWDGIDESQPERLAPDWENQRGETSGMVRDDEQNHVFTINLEIPARFELPA
jgi:hypothetical protein